MLMNGREDSDQFLPFRAETKKRRILSIDGGGVRGLISVEVLARLERELRNATGKSDLLLSDVFDLFAGTSSGAIVAASLALGEEVEHGRDFFLRHAPHIFKRSWRKILQARYDSEPLVRRLKDLFGHDALGSHRFRAILLVVLQNASTGSPWIITNHPNAKFNELSLDDCNLDLEVWRVIRASTAAPTYFPANTLGLGKNNSRDFVFVDGALTGLNNPSFRALMNATHSKFGICWDTGVDKLFLLSVGTGSDRISDHLTNGREPNFLESALITPRFLLANANKEQDLLCRVFGSCLAGPELDGEVGDLIERFGAPDAKSFTYVRINEDLSAEGFERLGCQDIDPSQVVALDCIDSLPELSRIGRLIAERYVDEALVTKLLEEN